ncbi:hypothetical protein PTTG_27217 [Puccinia triticina 1-1 BBBD Race 1]|uniref:Reverse transcriptase domain-containing protein n=1 Tax=Puccinia triticina (isolate 1-1 / race 1 (BBBD)) TaxID=630390 RepID=A0A180GP74_PUCT1|nr:hypothetical protein PTTG_27217 [Puccinia triticina 1-1 BBBD Race 1]
MFEKGQAAEEKGQDAQALLFYQMSAGLSGTISGGRRVEPTINPNIPPPPSTHQTPAIIRHPSPTPTPTTLLASIPGFVVPTPASAKLSRVRNFDEMTTSTRQPNEVVVFDDAAVPTNDCLGFTPFFEQNLLAFRAPLPLTIFNAEWQDRAILYQPEKKTKSDSGDKDRYTGYPYPSEYTQTYQEWSVNHQGFYEAVSKIPSHSNLVAWLIVHKRNADGIIKREGFMTALRYDIHVQTNTLTHRVAMPNGGVSVANISIFRREIVLNVHAKAVRAGETEYTDNPYAVGCCRHVGWDPVTGQQTTKKDDHSGKIPLHLQQPTMKSATNTLKPITDAPKGPSSSKEQSQRSSNYKGSRWNPHYEQDGGPNGGGNGGGGAGGTAGGSGSRGTGNNDGQGRGKQYYETLVKPEGTYPTPRQGMPRPQAQPTTTALWPSTVSCEMDLVAWKAALQQAGLLPEYQDVLDGFLNGFDQGIPRHRLPGNPPFFTPPNHTSAELAEQKIKESIQKELDAKQMFGPFTYEQVAERFDFFRTNPLGAVINGDGSLRPINDLSFPHSKGDIPSVNSFVDADDFATTWDDFNVVANFLKNVKGPVLLALFDWEKAYRQIPTAPHQWPYLMVRDFDDKLLLDTRITFGGVAGCGSFGRPADAWKKIMLAEFDVLNVFRWVDDNLFVKRPYSTTLMTDVVKRSDELGVKTNKEKYSPFLTEQKYVGFIWNGTEKTVRLPEKKLEKRVNQIQHFLEIGANFLYNEVEVIAGRLNHVSYMLPQLRCYLCGIYRWLKDWVHRETRRPIPKDAEEDLHVWFTTLKEFTPTRLIARQDPTEIGWVGDALTGYGIGVLIGRRWAQFRLRSIEELDRGLIENKEEERVSRLETVAVRLGLLMLLKLGARAGKTFIVWTDNTTTESVILKQKLKDNGKTSDFGREQGRLAL